MLRPPEHQVAGHDAARGQLGPLIDDSGRFYKPLQSSGRGDDELSFYTSLPSIPVPIRRFFPSFHGTTLLPSPNSEPIPHLIIDDLLAPLKPPLSVIDLKIGSRTWPPDSPDAYLMKCLKKDRETTGLFLGFRVSGVRIVQSGGDIWRPDRRVFKTYDVDGVRRVLRQFVSGDAERLDCERAVAVYGCVLKQLVELKEWFEVQTLFHFYSVSIIVGYGSDSLGGDGNVRVGLVDFAHVREGKGVIDHNFLGGLVSLIKFVKDILSEVGGAGAKGDDSVQGSELSA